MALLLLSAIRLAIQALKELNTEDIHPATIIEITITPIALYAIITQTRKFLETLAKIATTTPNRTRGTLPTPDPAIILEAAIPLALTFIGTGLIYHALEQWKQRHPQQSAAKPKPEPKQKQPPKLTQPTLDQLRLRLREIAEQLRITKPPKTATTTLPRQRKPSSPTLQEGDYLFYQGKAYKIAEIKTLNICGEPVHRYTTEDGGTFTHWTKQRKLNPPWITPWYEQNPHIIIYLKDNYHQTLFREAYQKAGSHERLGRALEELGYKRLSETYLSSLISGNRSQRGVETERLRAIMNYLDRDYDTLNPKIEGVGSRSSKALKEPKYPMNLNSPTGARIIAATLSDGGLGRHDKHTTFFYAAGEKELHDHIVKDVQEVFGNANYKHYDRTGIGRGHETEFGSEVLSSTIRKAGVPTGRKAVTDPDAPDFIKRGKSEIKLAFLGQALDDEGSVEKTSQQIIHKRSVDVSSRLSTDRKQTLTSVEWHQTTYPGRERIKEFVKFNELAEKVKKNSSFRPIVDEIRYNPPRLLNSEAIMLKETTGIAASVKPEDVYKTQRGFSAGWRMVFGGKENIRTFAQKIKLRATEKQKTIDEMLEEWDKT